MGNTNISEVIYKVGVLHCLHILQNALKKAFWGFLPTEVDHKILKILTLGILV